MSTEPAAKGKPAGQEINLGPKERWERLQRFGYHHAGLGLWLDLSCLRASEADLGIAQGEMAGKLAGALDAMAALEAGAEANPDEHRQVGHYWLRAPELAPDPALRKEIEDTLARVKTLAGRVHRGEIRPERGGVFRRVLVVGIGGSALGPELVADALASESDRLRVSFLDNTDPDGIDRVLDALGDEIEATLTVVISKSGGTKETRNGMLEAARAYERRGLRFGPHALAVTQHGSQLDQYAVESGFIDRLPMWDWVGGRTSVTSAVGLVPAALQRLDVDALLRGARMMDEATRARSVRANPAALLAAAWYHAGCGQGLKDMVVIPYKDRLVLLSRYLQQLVMESLGKHLDLDGRSVHQGIVVYGNKGSTDQHAYVQQLLDGPDNFFLTLIEVLEDRAAGREVLEVEPGVATGDYLSGFLQGTRRALRDRGRETLTLSVERVDALTLGALIALYERAVGLYASLIHINAYHQPGVESGKKAAADVLALQAKLCAALRANRGEPLSAEQLGAAVGSEDCETVFWVLRHLSANPRHGIRMQPPESGPIWQARFVAEAPPGR
jgi:glucose-6-phosphate isomerase